MNNREYKIKNMIVRVKPIKKTQQWSGFKGLRYNRCKDYLVAYYDKYGTISTGLNQEDEDRLGKILDKDLRNTSAFWHDYRVIMTADDLLLNTSNPEDELKYKFLLNHYLVKKSESDLNPRATYVIYNEEVEAEIANSVAEVKVKAFTLYAGLTTDQKKDILRLYPGYTKTDSVTPAVIDARLFERLEADPAKFVKIVEDKKMGMKIFLKDLVAAKVLRKNKNAYYYGEDALGHDEESTITHLDDPENQSLKVVLMQALKDKK